ncbi:hypothetical protein [Streptomyces fagopyri]|uniref:hypothetical protein n=1 Tax=Streptomyces fagopyri TaxID=2662397 RepID=UPI0034069BB5
MPAALMEPVPPLPSGRARVDRLRGQAGGQPGASSRPWQAADTSNQVGTFNIPDLTLAAKANPVTAQTASATADPAGAGSTWAGSSASATPRGEHLRRPAGPA